MKKGMLIIILNAVLFLFQGCLVFNKIDYEIKLTGEKKGLAKIYVKDIRSDAQDQYTLKEDRQNLYEYFLRSQEFLDMMKNGGNIVHQRKITIRKDTVYAYLEFSFEDISKVRAINYDAGFYFLTIPIGDSIIKTNGEVLNTGEYQRILWNDDFEILNFSLLGNTFKEDSFTKLAPFYKPDM